MPRCVTLFGVVSCSLNRRHAIPRYLEILSCSILIFSLFYPILVLDTKVTIEMDPKTIQNYISKKQDYLTTFIMSYFMIFVSGQSRRNDNSSKSLWIAFVIQIVVCSRIVKCVLDCVKILYFFFEDHVLRSRTVTDHIVELSIHFTVW